MSVDVVMPGQKTKKKHGSCQHLYGLNPQHRIIWCKCVTCSPSPSLNLGSLYYGSEFWLNWTNSWVIRYQTIGDCSKSNMCFLLYLGWTETIYFINIYLTLHGNKVLSLRFQLWNLSFVCGDQAVWYQCRFWRNFPHVRQHELLPSWVYHYNASKVCLPNPKGTFSPHRSRARGKCCPCAPEETDTTLWFSRLR